MEKKEKYVPILFATDMVKSILNGTKTQTRRIIKSKETLTEYEGVLENKNFPFWEEEKLGKHLFHTEDGEFLTKPKCDVGDVFWVRETFCEMYDTEDHQELEGNPIETFDMGIGYKADGKPEHKYDKWKPSIFMPRSACRIFLEVTNVRVERLQDISEEDSKDEGINVFTKDGTVDKYDAIGTPWVEMKTTAKFAFKQLWDFINLKRIPWSANPWVFVYDFKIINKPINFK